MLDDARALPPVPPPPPAVRRARAAVGVIFFANGFIAGRGFVTGGRP